jgi:hypothetical protein
MSDDTGNKGVFVRIPPALLAVIKPLSESRHVSLPAILIEAAIEKYDVEAPLPVRGLRTNTPLSMTARAVAEREAKAAIKKPKRKAKG